MIHKGANRYKVIQRVGILLPPEYQRVEYIESTGTQWIDTGVTVGNDELNVVAYFMPIAFKQYYDCVFGRNSNFQAGYNSNNKAYIGNAESTDKFVYLNQKHKFEAIGLSSNTGQYYVDDKNTGLSRAIGSNYSILLFAANSNAFFSIGRMYSFKIIRDNIEIMNLIPCYRKSDNEAGLYDMINNGFYTNQGTGKFIIGDEPICFFKNKQPNVVNVPPEYQRVEYVKSTGTQYIDTGVNPQTNPRVVAKLAIINDGDKDYWGNSSKDGSSYFANFSVHTLRYYRYGGTGALNTQCQDL